MTPEAAPILKQIKASAGSGKTYELTRTFLEYMRRAGRTPSPACGTGSASGYGWPEILAVTFTNKAATEMKERVVSSLKARALGGGGTSPAGAWAPDQAEAGLRAILRRYHRLNIRTIDSLLTLIMRIFALDAELPPDFEVCFDLAELFDPALDRFLARCEQGPGPELALLDQALATMIEHENRRGFLLMDAVRDRLRELCELADPDLGRVETDQKTMADMLSGPWAAYTGSGRTLKRLIAEHKLKANKNFLNYLDKCEAVELFDGPPKSVFSGKPSLAECMNAASRDAVPSALETLYAAHTEACREYAPAHAVLEGAYALAPCAALARDMAEDLARTMTEKGMVPLSGMARRVHDLLDFGGVPDAYCRLGGRLHHMLIDEFQDTSRAQWSAMAPLAGECLSKGGSLVYVGDAKQAIYGWRGGDSTLFDAVARDPELASAAPECEVLGHNWRSAPELVDFNNRFFENLADPDLVADLALMPDAPDDAAEEFAARLARTFDQVSQSPPPDSKRTGGYVRLARIPAKGRELLAATEAPFTKLVAAIARRRPLSDIAVLVRSNVQAGLVSEWLVKNGLPVVTENSLSLARHPLVRRMVSFLRFLDYPPDNLAFFEFIAGPELFPPVAGLDPDALNDWLPTAEFPLYKSFARDFPGPWAAFIAPFFSQAAQMTPYDAARELAGRLDILARHPEHALPVLHFLETVHLAGESGADSLAGFLEFWDRSGRDSKAPMPEHVDAVRIMTIHKSKGLEFPVVVVPFHDWSVRVAEDYVRTGLGGLDFLVPMRKALGRPYWDALQRSTLEEVNLLYVAWTRAAEELHGFLPEEPGGASFPALRLINDLLGDQFSGPVFEAGTRPGKPRKPATPATAPKVAPPPVPIETENLPERLMSWLPRLRIYRHTLEDTSWPRVRGEVFHSALERLSAPESAAPADAARAALDALPVPDAERDVLKRDLADTLDWIMGQEPFAGWIRTGRPEAEILDDEGQVHRADLLAETPERWVVLEYKTGQPRPEHAVQVRRYLSLLAQTGGKPEPPAGWVVLLDEREIVSIDPEDAA